MWKLKPTTSSSSFSEDVIQLQLPDGSLKKKKKRPKAYLHRISSADSIPFFYPHQQEKKDCIAFSYIPIPSKVAYYHFIISL